MRLLVTADLHYNHPRSRPEADDLIDKMNRAGGDAILLIGDTAPAESPDLELCLTRFNFPDKVPKLFLAGNHELWTRGPNSYHLFTTALPQRVGSLGWRWLETDPFVTRSFAIVGTIGWYDYTFAPEHLAIPRRFYEHKLSPGAARQLSEYQHLLQPTDDIPLQAMETTARWNDGKFIKLHRTDEAFLAELLAKLESQLSALTPPPAGPILAATHHLPFRQLLPPPRIPQWDFAHAFLGSEKLGALLLAHPAIAQALSGHSHFPAEATIGRPDGLPPLHARNIGSGYRSKTYLTIELPD